MSLPAFQFSRARRRLRRFGPAFVVTGLLGAAVAVPTGPAHAAINVSINDVSVIEGDSGLTTASFTVSLDAPSALPVSVDYFTANGSAVGPDDYILEAGTVSFVPGDVSETVDIAVRGDRLDEGEETFSVQLVDPVNALISDFFGQARILDDDVAPNLTIDDVMVKRDSGSPQAVFTVKLFPRSAQVVTVEFHTANGTAHSPDDYEDRAGLLTFEPGDTTERISVPVKGDDINEDEEFFTVILSNPTNADLADSVGVATITDNDVVPRIGIDDVEVVEGDRGTVDAVFTVLRYPDSGDRVTVEYGTENGNAVAPQDYQATAGLLVFDPGETVKTVRVKVKGDEEDERRRGGGDDDDDDDDRENVDIAGETFFVRLTNPTEAFLADNVGRAVIIDDDLTPRFAVNDATVREGNAGTTEMDFRVSLFPTSGEETRVEFTTQDGDAVAPGDYKAVRGVLTFEPGDRTQTVTVKIVGDRLDELDETLFLTLDNPVNAALGDSEGTGTIADDESAVSLSVTDASVTEGGREGTVASFFVELNRVSEQTVSFEAETLDDTAVTPADYTATGGSYSIAPGETRLRITVEVKPDSLQEDDETFVFRIGEPTNAVIADAVGEAVIADDDHPGAPRVSVAATSTGAGYWMAAADGDVYAFGDAGFYGSTGFLDGNHTGVVLGAPVVGIAGTRNDRGYWLVAADGGIFAFGNAGFFGSTGGVALNHPIVGMTATVSGRGYWLVAADGGIFAFGDAAYYGSTGGTPLNRPVVGMAASPSGYGYYLVASDGGVFTFGDAGFHGSTGAVRLNRPIVGIAASPDGGGYWMVASDGGIFAFGDANFYGSTGGVRLAQPMTAISTGPSGEGYWLMARDGGIFAFGDVDFFGSTGGVRIAP